MNAHPRVATYGYFGMGNIGNEGSIAAFLAYLRAAHPESGVRCFAADPDAVRRDHQVDATQLMTLRAADHRRLGTSRLAKALSRIWDIPRTFVMMRAVDVLVVPGTGVFETSLIAQPWGEPYWLFLAVLSCRLRNRAVLLLSIGAEYTGHPVIRRLNNQVNRMSTYCSFRDAQSREAIRAMGGSDEPGEVVADLAFALETPTTAPIRSKRIVIGVMAYDGDPRSHDRPRHLRQEYGDKMTRLVGLLLDDGYAVTLTGGAEIDRAVATEIEHAVRSRPDRYPTEQVCVSAAVTLEEIMREMGKASVVVVSRYHNLICALAMCRPTVSLGYAEKSDNLMAEFGLGQFSQHIASFDVDSLLEQIRLVQQEHASVAPHMADTLRRFHQRLDEQFATLSADYFGGVSATIDTAAGDS